MFRLDLPSYSELKSRVLTPGLRFQFVEDDEYYDIYSPHDGLIFTFRLAKDGSADQTDFESNFKSVGNELVAQQRLSDGGRLKVDTRRDLEPPPGATAIVLKRGRNVPGGAFVDDTHLVPDGKEFILTLVFFAAASDGGSGGGGGSALRVFDDPNGDGTNMDELIAFYGNGSTAESQTHIVLQGDGIRRLRVRSQRLSNGTVRLFHRIQGFERPL